MLSKYGFFLSSVRSRQKISSKGCSSIYGTTLILLLKKKNNNDELKKLYKSYECQLPLPTDERYTNSRANNNEKNH